MAGQISGIILSGGQNSRMKTNKAFLKIDNQYIIENTISELKKFCSEIIIVTNEPELYNNLGVKVITDVIPRRGPLSGIHAGLLAAGNFQSFVVACDMPFINGELARYMVEHATDCDVLVPQVGDYLQPLFAVYSKNCLPPIESCLKRDMRKIIAFYHEVRVKYLSEIIIRKYVDTEKVFYNVNTPEELDRAQRWDSRQVGVEKEKETGE